MADRLIRSPVLLLGLAAAAPSVAWGLVGADYLSDDFEVAHRIARLGLVDGVLDLSFNAPARPLVGPYYLLAYEVIGERFLVQALVMAMLNAALVVVLWMVLRAVVSARTALLAALVFAVVPNRGSTRLWFVLGPNLLAVACVAGGAALLVQRNQVLAATGLFVVAILAYEGVAGVALVVLGWWWFQDRAARARAAVVALAPVAVAVATAWVVSPKRDGTSPGPFANVDTIGQAQFGSGFWGVDELGIAGTVVAVGALTWALAVQLPSFRLPGSRLPREILLGSCLLVVGALPFLIGGAPFAVRGIFDRNNLVPDVGSCLIVGALLAAVVRRWQAAGSAVALVVVALLAAGNVADVRDYRDAVSDGRELVDAVLADVDPAIGTVVVAPPLPGDKGVEQFILDGDLTAALQLRHGPSWASVSMPLVTPPCTALLRNAAVTGTPVFVYDRLDRRLERVPDGHGCGGR